MPNSKKPVFFMHIAKTAGSYVNELFIKALGDDNCILHSEHTLQLKYPEGDPVLQAVEQDRISYISGHVYLRDWLASSARTNTKFINITTIREPISHLASHIQWLDHYNLTEKKREYNQLSSQIKLVVDEISKVDFNQPGDIDLLLTNLTGSGIQLLDNCQSRYFVCGYGSDIARTDALSLNLTPVIQKSIDQFDLVLTQDRLNEGVTKISELTGHPLVRIKERINTSKSLRTIDTSNRVIRSVLSKRCLVDQWLWRSVKSQTVDLPAPELAETL